MGSEGTGLFNTPDISALTAGLDVLSLQQRLTANNLANEDTPGYRRAALDFNRAFSAALAAERGKSGTTSEDGLADAAGSGSFDPAAYVTRSQGVIEANGNGVDLDQEMVTLSETGMHYQATSQLLSLAFARLRTAISGRE